MNPEYPSDYPENESAVFNYDWIPPSSAQSSAFDFPADPLLPHEDLVTSDRPITKVAIPRIVNPSTWTSSSSRVSRACENCHEQKAKCSGHRPVCHRCKDADIRCSYGDRKRERMAKQLSELTAQVETYEALLQDLYPRLDAPSALHVDQTLEKLSDSSVLHAAHEGTAFAFGAIDYTEEDFNRDEKLQAMGFVGEHSEMAWLYRLKRDLDQAKTPTSNRSDYPSILSVNYFQDDSKLSVLDDVDPLARPPQHVASQLVDGYFHTIHPTFPIIGITTFIGQYNSFYTDPNVRPSYKKL